jgi:hypothetical protein
MKITPYRITVTVVLSLLAFIVGMAFKSAFADAACQRHRYMGAMAWPTVTYCYKRVDNTDVVVRLDSLGRAK